jgi:hypothetical protein
LAAIAFMPSVMLLGRTDLLANFFQEPTLPEHTGVLEVSRSNNNKNNRLKIEQEAVRNSSASGGWQQQQPGQQLSLLLFILLMSSLLDDHLVQATGFTAYGLRLEQFDVVAIACCAVVIVAFVVVVGVVIVVVVTVVIVMHLTSHGLVLSEGQLIRRHSKLDTNTHTEISPGLHMCQPAASERTTPTKTTTTNKTTTTTTLTTPTPTRRTPTTTTPTRRSHIDPAARFVQAGASSPPPCTSLGLATVVVVAVVVDSQNVSDHWNQDRKDHASSDSLRSASRT